MVEMEKFRKSLQFTLKHEGGYVNHPADPGGETKWGISKRAYPDLDIGNLTPLDAANIYAKDYWDASGCDAIPFPFCTAVFDSSVLCGVGRTKSWMRQAKDLESFITLREAHHLQGKVEFRKGWLNRLGDLKKFLEINKAPN